MTPDRPGFYVYFDPNPGAEPQPVQVVMMGKTLVARFEAEDPADSAEIRVSDMAGTFQPAQAR